MTTCSIRLAKCAAIVQNYQQAWGERFGRDKSLDQVHLDT